ncbi:MAG: nitronate monooxygenase [Candidatus Marinimicrobia bacterium]|jgi:nitronate monooxygenase|nr:nitronate monooxygenase [Candidatus Neomarinimicrobiota bacterium]MBT3631033.1 nitronate monooxygenase [Candidatus Neomarinimicrobiota bacterium]MBT3825673.1 nitronate monooxygenase [Candidatus Neomarinimicrobiota bacterium]MBT4130583.1 nitronate monooxygenase [Candidatus Neomarinimicrobiota bacterium]MBT4296196.1 nitronate monooxygenase [Candidatus Neomarinimicrobiota bacterium]
MTQSGESQKPFKTFCNDLDIALPIIGGAMYPCSNPELVAAISEAGGIGIVQPLSLTYVHGHDFREGLRHIRSLTSKPIGVNLLIEKSSQRYLDRIKTWLDISLEEGVSFFVTALGNPRFFADKIHAQGGLVYHNTTNRKWAEKALDGGVDGLICVNDRAGGHAGTEAASKLYEDLIDFGKPLICAGGISTSQDVASMLDMGYSGIQMGTRFIATQECTANQNYKQAILDADENKIVLTDKLSGVPVSIIETDYIKNSGSQAGAFARWMLRGSKTKKYMRMFYSLRSFRTLKSDLGKGGAYQHFLQAGKSVGGIHEIQSVAEIMVQYRKHLTPNT